MRVDTFLDKYGHILSLKELEFLKAKDISGSEKIHEMKEIVARKSRQEKKKQKSKQK